TPSLWVRRTPRISCGAVRRSVKHGARGGQAQASVAVRGRRERRQLHGMEWTPSATDSGINACQSCSGLEEKKESAMNDTLVAVDLAKTEFEIAVSMEAGKISRRLRPRREKALGFFAQLPA